jgi:hypothetical protein
MLYSDYSTSGKGVRSATCECGRELGLHADVKDRAGYLQLLKDGIAKRKDGWGAVEHEDGTIRALCPDCQKVAEAERMLDPPDTGAFGMATGTALDSIALNTNIARLPGETDAELRARLRQVWNLP